MAFGLGFGNFLNLTCCLSVALCNGPMNCTSQSIVLPYGQFRMLDDGLSTMARHVLVAGGNRCSS